MEEADLRHHTNPFDANPFHAKILNLLELSVYHKKIDVVKFLLKCGMTPHLNNDNSIKIATELHHIEIKDLLLTY